MIEYSVNPMWYDGLYRDVHNPCSAARSFSMAHKDGAKAAALLIHGYAGYPGELVSPAKELFDVGFDVFVPRLPGMGTSGKDFSLSRAEDWLSLVEKASEDLFARYDTISVVAHSMGCLLAVLASAKYPYSKAVLASPAFNLKIKVPKILLKGMLKAGKDSPLPWKADPSYKLLYENAPCDDEYLGSEYWSHLYPGPFLDMLDLQQKVIKKIPDYRIPSLVLYGTCDELVTVEYEGFPSSMYFSLIEGGSHYLYYDKNRQSYSKAVSESVRFLSEG